MPKKKFAHRCSCNIGYEPKSNLKVLETMAERRSRSEPRANPFWSDKAAMELMVQSARPADLPKASPMLPPVPPDQPGEWEQEGGRMEETPEPLADRRGEKEKRKAGQNEEGEQSTGSMSLPFKTPPSSWKRADGVWRRRISEGMMPADAPQHTHNIYIYMCIIGD